ncbi:ferredoxin [Nonomuraea sp. NPDC050663]|uniref:Ferredoxin n=1 Tax=Nonomuraea soli TaxID=1032476 RepID=A0A7W0CIW5_9ACTN|nr:ferredoxin [Nonomuraea soli]MBA2892047.1 ferredoxin [Nonomuraea soli]
MKVTVDTERCIGSGMCVYSSEEVFDQDDDGTSIVLRPEPPAELWDAVRRAVDRCPASAIKATP